MYRRSYVPFNQFLQTGKTILWHIIKTDTETRHRPCPHFPVSHACLCACIILCSFITISVIPPPPQHRSVHHHKAPSGCPFRASIPNCLAPTNLFSILIIMTFREFNTTGIIQYVGFWDWHLPLCIILLGIHSGWSLYQLFDPSHWEQ